ncbi:hypothetical protein SAMN04488128_10450 [Chitinophaga eiseniae]|uniref:Uncharacterized protein n=1 Tax=Chitinophaga eiseniae TaxID=634771 RepID=A0A1T4T6Q1_9BACT|nr:hypothetical protein [Chitinophaga eiseniae]SKA36093.1 hypothetical protein SAMN04488128_10450 [Chitinophaga eiseniae]
MSITAIRILPPFAIARLGSSSVPQTPYDLQIAADKPVGFRQMVPQPSYDVDPSTGKISVGAAPPSVIFKDNVTTITDKTGKIRPVAPFLEVFALTTDKPDVLVPLTQKMLDDANIKINDFVWKIRLGNLKIQRRTGDPNDAIHATVDIKGGDYTPKPVIGHCNNFISGQSLPLGTVQFIQPTTDFPQIRLRYTPGPGKVYGCAVDSVKAYGQTATKDPNITDPKTQVIYDPSKPWAKYVEGPDFNPNYTMPAQIFAGYSDDKGNQYSWGYIDDECDGYVELDINSASPLVARATICAGPPAFAPDILPVRTIADELEQVYLGPDRQDAVPIEEAEEIVRRALESIVLMNTSVMNGNPINGRWNVASTMVRQDTNDLGRLYEPIMADSLVDNLALRMLHERVFNGLSTGMAAWFADALRRPDKIGDVSDKERRKMPGLMRGADGRALTLTWRMINTVIQAAANALFNDNTTDPPAPATGTIHKDDYIAQLNYRSPGNPYSVISRAAISNCFPGLESDFRNIWVNVFTGLVMSENDNYVISGKVSNVDMTGHRLIGINGKPTMVAAEGPVFPGGDNVPLATSDNPNGAVFMEWSNLIASLGIQPGATVHLQFTKEKATFPVLVTENDLKGSTYPSYATTMANFFTSKGTTGGEIDPHLVSDGFLTRSLCSPWQNDYRECACYYWAATRPDYVNVEPGENGLSKGDMWLSKQRTGEYVPDNRVDTRLASYNDLFQNWEGELNFIVKGNDALTSNGDTTINNL